ncbi:MAG: substrate-binding domain-containing protein [Anaerolineales bacterium]|nr:substrate-binding domain-containing protein [Anaerolineales bacterium]
MRKAQPLICLLLLLAACAPARSDATPSTLEVQFSAAAQPWLAALYDCAAGQNATVRLEQRAPDQFSLNASMAIRIGEPQALTLSAYQIGDEEIIIVVHPENPVTQLALIEVRQLFSGQAANWNAFGGPDRPVQPWVYAPGEDLQQVFARSVMQGAPVAGQARMAASPAEMIAAIGSDPAAIGVLTRSLLTGAVRDLRLPADEQARLRVPVLLLTPTRPDGTLAAIIACLQ